MSELNRGSTYSPAALAVLDAFCGWERKSERRTEYEARGLVCTNNLGLYMNTLAEGPGRLNYQIYYQALSPCAQTLLAQSREENPELWENAISAYRQARDAGQLYARQLAVQDPAAEATGIQFELLGWERDTLLSEVFEAFGPIEPEDALALCR
jgi:hypothetical protein